jgi:DNA-binding MarR family transcriptional regulator
MISRRRRGSDRRSIYLVVSARGHEQLAKISARRGDLLGAIFLKLPSPMQAQLAEVLPAFIEAAGDLEVDEWSIRGLVASRATAADWVQ